VTTAFGITAPRAPRRELLAVGLVAAVRRSGWDRAALGRVIVRSTEGARTELQLDPGPPTTCQNQEADMMRALLRGSTSPSRAVTGAH
jgi:hypothetical protein